MRRSRDPFLLGALLLTACQSPREQVLLRVELPEGLAGRGAELRTLPAIAEARREQVRGVVALELKRHAGKVTLQLEGACPLTVDTRQLVRDRATSLRLEPLFDVGPSTRVVGLEQPFELEAKPRCAEAQALRGEWRAAGGAALSETSTRDDGRIFSAKTPGSLPELPRAHGIVPVSARVKQSLTSAVTWRVELPGGAFERTVSVAAVARSSGLPNVGLTHPLLLSADGWRLFDKPIDSRAELRESAAGLFELRPDIPGKYRLSDRAGLELSIQSGRFDRMPLDCGRSDCHAAIAASVRDSPMTQALASDLGGCHSLSDPSCATACHTTGEPGTSDGGFSHVAAAFALGALPPEHDDLPQALRKLGGVGCMACHGPAAIPEPSARYHVMRSDVCAVCHDAPPRYNHVRALNLSRMSRADHDPTTREGNCARCHTSWGAVGRAAPPHAEQLAGFGITCSTCHDVHPEPEAQGAREPTHAGLLRAFALPPGMDDLPASLSGVSRVCVSCHAPSSTSAWPEASAASIILGRGGFEPASGAPLHVKAPHDGAPKGCVTCHTDPNADTLGKGHDFRARPETCVRCHADPKPRDTSLAERAQALLRRLAPELEATRSGPWHAADRALPADPTRARALRNVLLVLEDPAADVHHPRYASALLDAAEPFASGAQP
jgi:hypothetical protein